MKKNKVVKYASVREAVLCKCKDCMCDYVNGRVDCVVPTCPLYQWMPYKGDNGKQRKVKKKL